MRSYTPATNQGNAETAHGPVDTPLTVMHTLSRCHVLTPAEVGDVYSPVAVPSAVAVPAALTKDGTVFGALTFVHPPPL